MFKAKLNPREKAITSFRLGIIALFMVFAISILHDELPSGLIRHRWFDFLILLPAAITSAVGLLYGVESIKSSGWIYALFGILLSLIALGFVIIFSGPGACC